MLAAVGTAPDLVREAHRHAADLVVADIRMPPGHTDDGIVAARQIRADRPGTAIVLLSQYVEATAAVDLFQDNPAGLGYLLKDRVLQIEDFLASVRRVVIGGSAVDPAVVAQLVGRSTANADPLTALADREQEALALMAEGLSNGGIAARLHVGVRTVETYTSAVRQARHPQRRRRTPPGQGRPHLSEQEQPRLSAMPRREACEHPIKHTPCRRGAGIVISNRRTSPHSSSRSVRRVPMLEVTTPFRPVLDRAFTTWHCG